MTVYSTDIVVPVEVEIEPWMEAYDQTREEALADIPPHLTGQARHDVNAWLELNGFGKVPGTTPVTIVEPISEILTPEAVAQFSRFSDEWRQGLAKAGFSVGRIAGPQPATLTPRELGYELAANADVNSAMVAAWVLGPREGESSHTSVPMVRVDDLPAIVDALPQPDPGVWVVVIEWGSDYDDAAGFVAATEEMAWLETVKRVWDFYNELSEPEQRMVNYVTAAGAPDLTDWEAARTWYEGWREDMTEAWTSVTHQTIKAA